MNIVIFGAGGFIGSHLVKRLLSDDNFETTCLDLADEKLRKVVRLKEYNFQYCDIRRDHGLVNEVVGKSDIVIDLVAYANPAIYLKKPVEVVELNLFENLRIVEYCMRHKKKLVQFSSCEVYGKSGGSTIPFNEDRTDLILGPICNHRWIYSCAKQLLERIIHARGIRGELEYTIIRPFNFIGPEMDYLVQSRDEGTPRVFPHFMSALIFDKPMYLADGGTSKRTFAYIDDAIDAIIKIINSPNLTKNQIVNIGTPSNETTIKNLAYEMKELYRRIVGRGSKVPIIDISSNDFYGEGYEDCDRRIPDISKLKRLGWKPKYNLKETLRKSMEYYLKLFQLIEKR